MSGSPASIPDGSPRSNVLEATVVRNLLGKPAAPPARSNEAENLRSSPTPDVTQADGLPNSSSKSTLAPPTHLLKIYRREDRPPPGLPSVFWWKPWTWWSGRGHGPRVSPLVWEQPAAPSSAPDPSRATASRSARHPTQPEAAAVGTMEEAGRRPGLPEVNVAALTAAQVAALPPSVQEQRSEVLRMEEAIHRTLQGVEDTRNYYLSGPLNGFQCTVELEKMLQCYQRANTRSLQRQHEFRQEASRQSEAAARTASSSVVFARERRGGSKEATSSFDAHPVAAGSPWWLHAPIVTFEALECGTVTQELHKCAEKLLETYTEADVLGS